MGLTSAAAFSVLLWVFTTSIIVVEKSSKLSYRNEWYDEKGVAQSEMCFGDRRGGVGERFLLFLDGDKEAHDAAKNCDVPITLTLRHKQVNGPEGSYESASIGGPPQLAGELDVLLQQRVAGAIEDTLESFRNWEEELEK